MKILVFSDLHFEFHADHGLSFCESVQADYDLAIIAGDLCTYRSLNRSLTMISKFLKEVIFICGNHECWTDTIPTTLNRIEQICDRLPNVHFLSNRVLELQGQRFIGSTLWFPYPTANTCGLEWTMRDFDKIKKFYLQIGNHNQKDTSFLEKNVQENDIVITHYLPSSKSIHPKYARDNTNVFYLCDMERVIYHQKPKLWIHGHTHKNTDYQLEKTRIVCNPFGYVGHELNSEFKDNLVIEV